MRITVVARKIEDIVYAYTILFGGGEWRGQTSIINDIKAPCGGALLGTIKDAFTPRSCLVHKQSSERRAL